MRKIERGLQKKVETLMKNFAQGHRKAEEQKKRQSPSHPEKKKGESTRQKTVCLKKKVQRTRVTKE